MFQMYSFTEVANESEEWHVALPSLVLFLLNL